MSAQRVQSILDKFGPLSQVLGCMFTYFFPSSANIYIDGICHCRIIAALGLTSLSDCSCDADFIPTKVRRDVQWAIQRPLNREDYFLVKVM